MTDLNHHGTTSQSLHEQLNLQPNTPPVRGADDELADDIIADVSFIDGHRPPIHALWLFRQQVREFRKYCQWVEQLKAAEHGPGWQQPLL